MARRLFFHLAASFRHALGTVFGVDVVSLFADVLEIFVGSLELACKVVELVFTEGNLDSLPESLDGVFDTLILLPSAGPSQSDRT